MNSLRESLLQVSPAVIAAVMAVLIFILNWIGYRVRKRLAVRNPDKEISLGTAEGSLMGLMALLLAFSFGMSATKYESRRQTIIDEANLLNTAILRYDLYPDTIKKTLTPDFRNYLDARISYFESGDNPAKINAALEEADKYFQSIWRKNASLINDQQNRTRAEQLVPVLINLKNIVTTREAGRIATVPTLIVAVLLLLVFVASFLTGFGVKPGNRSPVFSLAFAVMTSIVLYLVMELGRPRQGIINLQKAEQEIVDLRKFFSPL